MRVVVQRSGHSQVLIDDKVVGEITKGIVLLVCVEKGDDELTVQKASDKIASLRIFEEKESGKMSKSLKDFGGEVLAISQFTLSWRGGKGNRPSFDGSMPPVKAEELFNLFCEKMKEKNLRVQGGEFGRLMKVLICNDGPVTFCLDF